MEILCLDKNCLIGSKLKRIIKDYLSFPVNEKGIWQTELKSYFTPKASFTLDSGHIHSTILYFSRVADFAD